MRDLQVNRIELDEAWSYVGKKQRLAGKTKDFVIKGDQYVFLALADSAKAIISYRVGKRNSDTTLAFTQDLRERVLGAPEISADAWRSYPGAIETAFGSECRFGTIEKHYSFGGGREASHRYSPGVVVAVKKQTVIGEPEKIGTSYIERQNLTLRMSQRRFTRLTNGFSKKLENHIAAVGLYVAHYNFCRVHEALRVTPAMQVGVTDHIWSIGELVEAALSAETMAPAGRRVGRFTVIDGSVEPNG